MVQYFLECIAFQLIFLLIYEVLLKRETFFQWNRVYLIGSYVLSMVLPWVKIEALGIRVPESYDIRAAGVFQLDALILTPETLAEQTPSLGLGMGIFYLGMVIATFLFGYKIYMLYRLRHKGDLHYFSQFTQVIIAKSNLAFSFFNTIFLGDSVRKEDYDQIVAHELVHIRQRHSLDLIFFEIMRIICWFNPMVYLYQRRISELHEFIADTELAVTDKNAQYQLLLSRVFQTTKISFVNPFFKSSLIKKRIVMLQKTKSKRTLRLKYVLLVPLVFGMLCYTSCELDNQITEEEALDAIPLDETTIVGYAGPKEGFKVQDDVAVPFAIIEEVPVFPGCEDATDKRACFNEKVIAHIRKNFKYPIEAQEAGIQGKVYLVFTVNTEGDIINLRKRGPAKVLEEAAERIINELPKMTPGRDKGIAVNVPFSIPITFKLHSSPPPPPISLESEAAKKLVNQYMQLLEEKERLLLTTDKSSVVVQNLDKELEILAKEISEQSKG